MKKIGLTILFALILSACANQSINKKPTAAQRARDVAQIKTQLAIEYMKTKNYRQAVEAIDEALKNNSSSFDAWLIRAQIWQYLKEPAKAEESFQRALSIAPNSAEVNNNYGWFLCDALKKPNASIAYFDKALTDPTYPTPETAQFNKGICSSRMGQYQLANSYFERALAANPNFIAAKKEMARNDLQSGSISEANYLFKQYQSQINKLSADDLLLGWRIERSLGNTQAAYEYEAQLRNNFPYSAELEQVSTGKF
ncbi:type IV pilus biogenesis/stability protein PilW [Snodgrassella communis]|uniref:Putative fimbrial biogenesis and twitching motility protein n=1 Tax=Snodgrassella communis TaxID=2946699 RepID=A0A066TTQ8_9NEIS|nr:type IV pilus biogenesis/stability protein PilW [Snodgrassella communis]KDN12951.1 putative fimbrial biogenesis and twitching motility protein [Snodgrassella communis]KDN15259.1 putative fimbrial biogenesis and twitching motility protein [Snodgrassella communis]PIT10397.1 type IV pilus biogenesis/stability protein PilW [Snodgrassella communis]PIT26871.1 type IV pilus biogenesis/stability protein PilW [Snodgrassella communis]PIT29710.1 type IV pilus biogenesis/stability protein PilW [Snodgra